jgi:VWFA-related protein
MFHCPRRRAGFLVLATLSCVVLLSTAISSHAQRGASRPNVGSKSAPAPYTIPVTVRRVVLDVVVTDAQHNPVQGLTKKDFSVFEDKKQQEIRSFEEYDFRPPSNAAPPKLPPLPPDTYVNAATTQERGPLYIIVYDAVHMEFDTEDAEDSGDQIQARKQLAAFLASKPSGTRFALFLLANDFRLLQGFTTDPNKLLAVFDVNRKEGHIPYKFLMGPNTGRADPDLPFIVMRFLGHYLEGLPGRKNLIWMSSHFPVDVPMFGLQNQTVGNVMSAGPGAAMQAQGFDGNAPTTLGESWDAKIMKQAIDALNAAQVSVYPVNVAGLNTAAAAGGIDTIADNIATATGGHAYYNTNDLKGAIEKATEDGASYYEISYAPTNMKEDGRQRNIQVNMDRKGYNLEYRRYYYAEDPDAPLTDEEKRGVMAVADQVVAHHAGDSMYAYMQHGAPIDHDILFRAQFHAGPAVLATPDQMASLIEQPAYFVVRKSDKPAKLPPPVPLSPYTIDYLVLDRSAQARNGQVLEFAAGAFDANGKLLNGLSQNAVRSQDANGASGQPIFRARQILEVPPRAAWLRVAVRDVNTDRIGTMEIPLPLASQKSETAAGPAVASPGNSDH